MIAGDIVNLLAGRHTEDLFVPECKDGPTWNGQHCRLDAWALRRSWSNYGTIGYEVKVSRSDWIGDTKYTGYRDAVHELWLACPADLIQVKEVPKGVGLLWVSKTGTRLYVKQKAASKAPNPERQILLMSYVLMSRVAVAKRFRRADVEDSAAYWRGWLAEKAENRELGHRVSVSLKNLHSERVTAVECRVKQAEAENARFAKVKAVMDATGISAWDNEVAMRQKLDEAGRWMTEARRRDMQRAVDALQEVLIGSAGVPGAAAPAGVEGEEL